MPAINEEEPVIHKVLHERLVGIGKNKKLEYLITFKNMSTDNNRWVSTDKSPKSERLLLQLLIEKRENRPMGE